MRLLVMLFELLWWLDANILDRVYQPLSERLGRWVSPFQLARFLAIGFPMGWIASLVYGTLASLGRADVSVATAATFWVVMSVLVLSVSIINVMAVYLGAALAERHLRSNRQTMNPNRFGGTMHFRVPAICIWPSLLLIMRQPNLWDAGELLWVSALYLVAVTWRPPAKREKRTVGNPIVHAT